MINKFYIKSELKRGLKSKNSLITFVILLILLAMGIMGIGDGANYIRTNGYNMIFSYLHLVLFFIIVLVGLRVIFKKNFYELFISGGF